MADLSNKTLALLVGVAIIVSLVGIFVAQRGIVITGLATTGTGQVNLTIQSTTSINVTNNIDFGPGLVNIGKDVAILYSNNGSTVDGNWSFSAQAISIVNDGTLNSSVTVKSDKNASMMIGGTLGGGPKFYYWVQNHEANSCVGGIKNGSTYATGDFTAYLNNTERIICPNLGVMDSANALNLSVYVAVPKDAPTTPATKTSTLTFTATAVS